MAATAAESMSFCVGLFEVGGVLYVGNPCHHVMFVYCRMLGFVVIVIMDINLQRSACRNTKNTIGLVFMFDFYVSFLPMY